MKKESQFPYVSDSGHGTQTKIEATYLDKRYAASRNLGKMLEDAGINTEEATAVDPEFLFDIINSDANKKAIGEMTRINVPKAVIAFNEENPDGYEKVAPADHEVEDDGETSTVLDDLGGDEDDNKGAPAE